jgi:hypothetical protein
MYANKALSRAAGLVAAAVFAVALSIGAAQAATDFAGTWMTTDTMGRPMQIDLYANGNARAIRSGERMTGRWASAKKVAVINWTSGWTTKIVKRGHKFKKLAYQNSEGKGRPVNKALAVKVR